MAKSWVEGTWLYRCEKNKSILADDLKLDQKTLYNWKTLRSMPNDHQFQSLAESIGCTKDELIQDYNDVRNRSIQPLIDAIIGLYDSGYLSLFKALQRKFHPGGRSEDVARALYQGLIQCGSNDEDEDHRLANTEFFSFLTGSIKRGTITSPAQESAIWSFTDAIALVAIASDTSADKLQGLKVKTDQAWVVRAAVDAALGLPRLLHCGAVGGKLKADYSYTRELSPCVSLNPKVRVRQIAETIVLGTAMEKLPSSDVNSLEYREGLRKLNTIVSHNNQSPEHRLVYGNHDNGMALAEPLREAGLQDLRVVNARKNRQKNDASVCCIEENLETFITDIRHWIKTSVPQQGENNG